MNRQNVGVLCGEDVRRFACGLLPPAYAEGL